MGSENKICFLFQSTHPRRVWLSEINRSHVHLCFNPHTHEGCDLLECSTNGNVKKFQSTHPRRVWLHVFVFLSRFVLFQSTHPRRVWHFLALRGGFGVGVSIHTPTKGVTLKQKQGDISEYVSIHTPTKGVTAEDWYHRPYIHCFNPHTHEGCDCSHHFRPRSATLFQSTHPRRVWRIRLSHILLPVCFNPHTHEGCDLEIRRNPYSLKEFQSTHPRRVWRQATYMHSHRYQFQSTHPRRVWHIANEENAREIFVSIHTPTKGVTQTFKPHRVTENVSIHTPTKGVTSRLCTMLQIAYVSIHTPTKGVTGTVLIQDTTFVVSIHTPTKGVTLHAYLLKFINQFQSTHPRRVWPNMFACRPDIVKFQSTHPRRVWPNMFACRPDIVKFQSTHPRRVWQTTAQQQTT